MEQNKIVANENFDWNAFENDLGVYDQSKEAIEAAYDQTMSNVAVGEVVEGTVTDINKREVTVNIGYKSEGLIAATEFRYNPDLTIGEKVEVYVESVEDKGGQLALSHKPSRTAPSTKANSRTTASTAWANTATPPATSTSAATRTT